MIKKSIARLFVMVCLLLLSNSVLSQFRVISNGEIRLSTNNMGPWDNSMITVVNHDKSKAYVVSKGGEHTDHRFYVRGDGRTFAYAHYNISNSQRIMNVLPIQNALGKIVSLNGVTYHLNMSGNAENVTTGEASDDSREMGIIASEVQPIVPEAVDVLEDGTYAVSYDALVSLLVEAVKEQQEEISMLQTSLLTQASELDGLVERVSACCPTSAENTTRKSGKLPQVYTVPPCKYSEDIVVKMYVPVKTKESRFFIFNLSGTMLYSFDVTDRGEGKLRIPKETICTGVYLCALLVDGQMTEMKKMFIIP